MTVVDILIILIVIAIGYILIKYLLGFMGNPIPEPVLILTLLLVLLLVFTGHIHIRLGIGGR